VPRDLPIGNQSVGSGSSLHVNFRTDYTMGEIYFPQPGRENQTAGRPWRVGVWADGEFRWLSDPSWTREMAYLEDTLVVRATLQSDELGLALECEDLVDYHRDVYLKGIQVRDLAGRPRDVRLFFHQNPFLGGREEQNTATYDPDLGAMVLWRGSRWVLATAWHAGRVGVDHYAAGLKEVMGLEGVWRACEGGRLPDLPVQHGSVDSAIEVDLSLAAGGLDDVWYLLAFGRNEAEVRGHRAKVAAVGPTRLRDRTERFWRRWVRSKRALFGGLSEEVVRLYRRSLLVMRTLTDGAGPVIAALDWDVASNIRENYSYCWMRDGALVANAWQRAGYEQPSTAFFAYCLRILEAGPPYFAHKYNADGTVASTWLPRVGPDGAPRLPIQEDETALVVWALWEHFATFREMTYELRELAYRLAFRAADWICEFRGPTGLPRPSYDLWEERWGVHLWTVAACHGALNAAARFAELYDEPERRERYLAVARDMQAASDAFWSADLGRHRRTLSADADGSNLAPTADGDVVDASLSAVWLFGMFPADDARVVRTMEAVRERLSVATPVGGVARYERDFYQTVEGAHDAGLPGNPWIICTLWLAMWEAARARTPDDLARAEAGLQWAARVALPSGVLAEQIHPHDASPVSVSPLTWSHSTFVVAVEDYLAARRRVSSPESRL